MVREEPAPKAKLPLFSIPKISSTPSAPAGSVPDLFRNPGSYLTLLLNYRDILH